MNRRCLAVAAASLSLSAFAAPPPKVELQEFPISCNAKAQALVRTAWDLHDNSRPADAIAPLQKALEADPACVTAKYFLAVSERMAKGAAIPEPLREPPSTLPEVERLRITYALQVSWAEDMAAAKKTAQRLTELQPRNWRAWRLLGETTLLLEQHDTAVAALEKATALNPKAGPAWNYLSYEYATAGRTADAVAAARKYAELSPGEPNVHDSFGDVLLVADKLDEAEAEYRKAIELSNGTFAGAWSGVAVVRFFKGDWDGGFAALDKQAADPGTRLQALLLTAWARLAQGKATEALAAVDELEKWSGAPAIPFPAERAVHVRAGFLARLRRPADALTLLAAADKAPLTGLDAGTRRRFTARRLSWRAAAELQLNKLAEAAASLAKLEAVAKEEPGAADLQELVLLVRGWTALAKKDFPGAVAALRPCPVGNSLCAQALIEAQQGAGDAAGAQAARAALGRRLVRLDQELLYVRLALLAPKGPATGK
jgi:tetratricopeptide (TPR) repeat protein